MLSFTFCLLFFILSFISSGTALLELNLSKLRFSTLSYSSSHVLASPSSVIFLISSVNITTIFSVSSSYFILSKLSFKLSIPFSISSFALLNKIAPNAVSSKLICSVLKASTFSSIHFFGYGVLCIKSYILRIIPLSSSSSL